MKRIVVLVVAMACAMGGYAQIEDGAVEKLMTRRALSCEDIELNALSMIPHLYTEHKTDTLDALLSYTARNCGMYEFIVSLNVLRDIENRTFNEEISNLSATGFVSHADNAAFYRQNIISYLQSYAQGVSIESRRANYFNYTVVAYTKYYELIHNIATNLQTRSDLTTTEKFLVNFYANPDTTQLPTLQDSVYKGTGIQAAYGGIVKDGGFSYGLTAGMWLPSGKLGDLGSHPSIGLILGGRSHRFMYDVSFNVRFVNTPNNHDIVHNDTLYSVKDFVGYYVGLDMGYALLYKKKHELDVLAGIAYDDLDLWNNPAKSDNSDDNSAPDEIRGSLNLNVGLGYKFYLTNKVTANTVRKSYLAIQAKYNFVNYKNAGGSDLTGNAMTITIIYGGYSRGVHHYYDN